jgi:hypothetical protein
MRCDPRSVVGLWGALVRAGPSPRHTRPILASFLRSSVYTEWQQEGIDARKQDI